MDDKKRRSTTDANLGREKDREGRRQRACARTQRLELDYSVGAGVPVCRSSKLHLEFPNHHSEILIWNFQITIRSIGTNFRMDSKWFQMQGLDLILETSK